MKTLAVAAHSGAFRPRILFCVGANYSSSGHRRSLCPVGLFDQWDPLSQIHSQHCRNCVMGIGTDVGPTLALGPMCFSTAYDCRDPGTRTSGKHKSSKYGQCIVGSIVVRINHSVPRCRIQSAPSSTTVIPSFSTSRQTVAAYQQHSDVATIAVASQAAESVPCNTTCLLTSTRLIRAGCCRPLAVIHILNLRRRKESVSFSCTAGDPYGFANTSNVCLAQQSN